jgi:hypothetical protein
LGLVILLASATGCAKAQAKAAPEGPPLAVPQPPPRVVAPIDGPLASAPAIPEVPVAAPRAPARPPARPSTPPAQAESKPVDAAPAAAQTPPPAATEPLRPAPSPTDAAQERKIREVLVRATRDLGRIDYGKLTTNGREQYEQAKRLNEQAEQAIRDRNYVFATTLADKAANMATELLPR